MPPDAITVDTSRAVGMFERLAANADRLGPVVERSAHKMLATASGVPVDTGRLAGSLRVKPVGEASALILSDVVYASYVFYGTRYVEPQPPRFAYTSDEFARDIARELFR